VTDSDARGDGDRFFNSAQIFAPIFQSYGWLAGCLTLFHQLSGPYGKGYPRGKKTAAGRPPNGRKAVWGVAHPQGVEGSGIARPGETLGSPWILLALRP
jgi:hypothetical protein